MCGITGIHSQAACVDPSVLSAMTDALRHRGPDDSGTYVSQDGKVGLGHTRLSVIDLSERGRQPMASDDLKIQISYNGEIYNYREIKEELRSNGHIFRTDCDTEVLVKAYEQWGIECLHKFIGMFALAIWDGRKNRLYLARDRVGIKPLYYYSENGLFLFASELKSIIKHPGFSRRISTDGLALFLRNDYIASPHTIYENTFKLEPGHYLCLRSGRLEKHRYWNITESYNAEPYDVGEEEACEMFEDVMLDSLRCRLVSDVPVGLFLSGGIDSGLVATLLRKNLSKTFKTFTIGFDEDEYNEAGWARDLAEHLETEHVEAFVSEKQAAETVFDIPSIYDEPFADSSSIPTCAVSRLAREHVKVVMSGDGGDELFCGYSHYPKFLRFAQRIEKTPRFIQNAFRSVFEGLTVRRFETAGKLPGLRSLAKWHRSYRRKRAAILAVINGDMAEMYRRRTETWSPEDMPGFFEKTEGIHKEMFDADFDAIKNSDLLKQMLYADFNTWLPDDILTKVDRASMSTGLEAREPLLDHRVVDLAARIPKNLKYRNGESKYLLKKVLSKYIPEKLYLRPKKGFGIPTDKWLKGEFKPLVREYLGEGMIRKTGVFNPKEVSRLTNGFYEDSSVRHTQIWNLLMFQMWHEKWH